MEDELKWMTPRKTWKYIPNRYQALVAQIVAALLYFNMYEVVFRDRSNSGCGSYFKPRLNEDNNPRGWIWNSFSANETYCSSGYFNGILWEFICAVIGLAICGVVMRKAIKRMPSEHREATKNL